MRTTKQFERNKADLLHTKQDLAKSQQKLTETERDRDTYRLHLHQEEKSHDETKCRLQKKETELKEMKDEYNRVNNLQKNVTAELVRVNIDSREKDKELQQLKQTKNVYTYIIQLYNYTLNETQKQLNEEQTARVQQLSYAREQLMMKDEEIKTCRETLQEIINYLHKENISWQNYVGLADIDNGGYVSYNNLHNLIEHMMHEQNNERTKCTNIFFLSYCILKKVWLLISISNRLKLKTGLRCCAEVARPMRSTEANPSTCPRIKQISVENGVKSIKHAML